MDFWWKHVWLSSCLFCLKNDYSSKRNLVGIHFLRFLNFKKKKVSLLFGVLFNVYYFLSSFLFFLSFLPPFCILVKIFHFSVFFGWSLDEEHWKTGAQRKCLRHLLATEAIPYLPCWKMRVKMVTQLLSKEFFFYQKERFISSTWYQSLGNDQLTLSLWDM